MMRSLLVVSFLLLVVSLMSGCSERIESTKYYYSPSWTRDGKIVFIGATESVRKDALGSQLSRTYSEYVRTIYSSGTGESSTFFDATGNPPYSMSCSPTRDYVAYMDSLRSGLFGKMVIYNIAAGEHAGMESFELLFSPDIRSFDWSGSGNQIVYCTTREVRIRDWNDFVGTTDTLVTSESDLEFVSWKYGDRIAFVYSSVGNKLLSLIYSNGTGRINLAAGASVDKPQISSVNTNEVYGISSGTLAKVDVSVGTPATSEVKAGFAGVLPRLSPDATQVVYSKSGESSGVYVLDIATQTEIKIK